MPLKRSRSGGGSSQALQAAATHVFVQLPKGVQRWVTAPPLLVPQCLTKGGEPSSSVGQILVEQFPPLLPTACWELSDLRHTNVIYATQTDFKRSLKSKQRLPCTVKKTLGFISLLDPAHPTLSTAGSFIATARQGHPVQAFQSARPSRIVTGKCTALSACPLCLKTTDAYFPKLIRIERGKPRFNYIMNVRLLFV